MSLVVCDNFLRLRGHDERRLFSDVSAVAAGAKARIGMWASRTTLKNVKRWKMKMPSFRVGTLGNLALGVAVLAVAVLEELEQLRGSDTTALEKSAGLGMPEARVRPVVEGSALEAM